MDKEIEVNSLRRSDVGGRHRKYRYGGYRIGMYGLNGELEGEWSSIEGAVEGSGIEGVTYSGVVNCISGRIKRHAGKIWRKERVDGEEKGRGEVER